MIVRSRDTILRSLSSLGFHPGVGYGAIFYRSVYDQLSGADVAMGEQCDNACVECLVMKCVGAEHLQ